MGAARRRREEDTRGPQGRDVRHTRRRCLAQPSLTFFFEFICLPLYTFRSMCSAHFTIGASTILPSIEKAPRPSAWCFAFSSRMRLAKSRMCCVRGSGVSVV